MQIGVIQIEGKRKGAQPRQQTEARKQAKVWQAIASKMDDLHNHHGTNHHHVYRSNIVVNDELQCKLFRLYNKYI
jgi:hypothetical protein